jgi:3-hydroxyacyl-CoA dehydrogenase/enoyl-CoA hydratase/3-hydroxybutyryl-CoA epimerase/3-hydroxyacyl-CoA dehydrogenase/enoyl-CoA hydratase/3-hydroxybutyryl-CoA epimerase/enoyl-CoA isomerase
MHFFNPVRRRRLVEVVRGARTSDETIATAVAYAKRLGKLPIVVNDGPGFLVNRLLLPYLNEALELLCDGAAIGDVERAAEAFGMLLGPLAMYDMIGLDTALMAGLRLWEAFPDRIPASPLLPALVKRGRLGQKSGQGFFSYLEGSGGEPDPDLAPILAPYIRRRAVFTQDEIASRLFLPVLLEATRALEEGIVRDPRDVDVGVIYGLGFPPSKGGLLFWADRLGAGRMVEMLKPLEHLGKRARPTPLLLEMAKEGAGFYRREGRGG